MIIKVCGITSSVQANQLAALGVQQLGFIFYEKSPRYVLNRMQQPDFDAIDPSVRKTGVFVNAPETQVKEFIEQYGLQAVQLHGDESPAYCAALAPFAEVMKAIRVEGMRPALQQQIQPYQPVVQRFLFDTATAGFGGSGQQFNWDILGGIDPGRPYLLSGGIGPGDAEKIRVFQASAAARLLAGVDLNSRFETAPGVKDISLVQAFIQHLQHDNGKTCHGG
jgi:phosphoribosylanthranilate isomerase